MPAPRRLRGDGRRRAGARVSRGVTNVRLPAGRVLATGGLILEFASSFNRRIRLMTIDTPARTSAPLARWLRAGIACLGLSTLIAGGGLRQDELDCEQAVAHLQD